MTTDEATNQMLLCALSYFSGALLVVSIVLTAISHHHTAWPAGIVIGGIATFLIGVVLWGTAIDAKPE